MNPFYSILLMLPFIGLVGWGVWAWKDNDDFKAIILIWFFILGVGAAFFAFLHGLFSLISH